MRKLQLMFCMEKNVKILFFALIMKFPLPLSMFLSTEASLSLSTFWVKWTWGKIVKLLKRSVFKKLHPISEQHMLLSKILPQIFKNFTQIYLPYLWHFATLPKGHHPVWKRLFFIVFINRGVKPINKEFRTTFVSTAHSGALVVGWFRRICSMMYYPRR